MLESSLHALQNRRYYFSMTAVTLMQDGVFARMRVFAKNRNLSFTSKERLIILKMKMEAIKNNSATDATSLAWKPCRDFNAPKMTAIAAFDAKLREKLIAQKTLFLISKLEVLDSKLEVLDSKLEVPDSKLQALD